MHYAMTAMLALILAGGLMAQQAKPEKPAKKEAAKEEGKKDEKAKKPTDAEVKKKLAEKVSVEFEEMTVSDILKACAEAWKLEFTLPEKIEGDTEISLSLKDTKASDVLKIICMEADLKWEVKGGKVVFKAAE
ncbi:MAG: hypothetical protein KF696_13615 [Planctomycetes bacterium]|nr:hypothetical protein [Planctomycetota bacterium]MCW8137087.1 hypothetical protein [Planctomycetota bacterium]